MTTHPKVDVPPLMAGTLQRLHRWREVANGARHRRYIMWFMVIVLGHWVEHIFQAVQVWVLGWPRADSLGALGEVFPWLVRSEWLHYGYALAMLIGIILLRPGFTGTARTWWTVALVIQVWHHFEHLLLLGQAITDHPLFGADKPTSIIQLLIPRIELHMFYNGIVFTPMVIAIYQQFFARPRPAAVRA